MNKKQTLLSTVICIAISILCFYIGSSSFLNYFKPNKATIAKEPFKNYQHESMQNAMDTNKILTQYEKVSSFGSRYPGAEGTKRTADYLKNAYQQAGLTVLEQNFKTVYPKTEYCYILDEKNKKINIPVHTLLPNLLQGSVTPKDGINGKLILVNNHNLINIKKPREHIALIDLSLAPTKALGKNVEQFAAYGFSAVIFTHKNGLKNIDWKSFNYKFNIPVNFVRLYSDPKILSLKDQQVTLHVKQVMKPVATKNIIAFPQSNHDEAVIIPVSYDTCGAITNFNLGSARALQLATQLQLLEGLKTYKQLQRDVIFMAISGDMNGNQGTWELIKRIGNYNNPKKAFSYLQNDIEKNDLYLKMINTLQSLVTDTFTKLSIEEIDQKIAELPIETQKFLDEQFRFIMKSDVLQKSEHLLQSKILFEKSDTRNLESDQYKAYRKSKAAYDTSNNQSAYAFSKALYMSQTNKNFISIFEKVHKRLSYLKTYHLGQQDRLKADKVISKRIAAYKSTVVIHPAILPNKTKEPKEQISLVCGWVEHSNQAIAIKSLLEQSIQNLKLEDKIDLVFYGKAQRRLLANLKDYPVDAHSWSTLSFPAALILNPTGSYEDSLSLIKIDYSKNIHNSKYAYKVFGESVLSAALGNGFFTGIKYHPVNHHNGTVYINNVGNSVVPNHPAPGALIFTDPNDGIEIMRENHYMHFAQTDPYGSYDVPLAYLNFFPGGRISPQAALFGEDGLLKYYKDNGLNAQNIYKSIKLHGSKISQPVNLVLFRSNPVAILDLTNPQTLTPYSGVSYIKRRGLQSFQSINQINLSSGYCSFVEPDETLFVQLKAGSPENEQVQQTRAFMLNTPEDLNMNSENEIDGRGYLAQETPIIYNVPNEVARSMYALNNKRVLMQNEYGMIDDMTQAFHQRAGLNLQESSKESSYLKEQRKASDSVVYSTLNHPIIRGSISEAIWGILWYMALLVPFVFFFEKLLFASTDIRKALTTQAIVFLVIFALLRILHPAFEMIRSSIMILLGFIILMISSGITLILSGKFKENLEALQSAKGEVKGATDNKTGIMITAFMLGLNNMNRRKVRTGLTCTTLILLTFVMICFTSIQSNISDSIQGIGKSSYQGILLKHDEFFPVSDNELAAVNKKYGDDYTVTQRQTYYGTFHKWSQTLYPPKITISFGKGDAATEKNIGSAILFDYNEPLSSKIKLLTNKGWFTKEQSLSKDMPPIMIPKALADHLNIRIDDVNNKNVEVLINGSTFIVHAIYDEHSVNKLNDIDNDSILPFDIETLITPRVSKGSVLASKDAERIQADNLIIGLVDRFETTVFARGRQLSPKISSVIINMQDANYKTAKSTIDSYLEQSGKSSFFGLDGQAFVGKRTRENSLAGLIDMLIPLLIAGLTVLNTMKGSVYERKDEIYVYNAVGIAPKYIFFMFIAEAMVYAVIGSLLGYILSQGTGRILTALDLTGGMNMNFTSLSTVYASLTIAAAVFISTYFPARSAMDMASPAEDSGWSLPESQNDELSFNLPFTFTPYDRIAVLAFFYRYFDNHGEGSAGQFFAGKPSLGLAEPDSDDPNYVPMITASIWLKPFDLGVSQQMNIELQSDKETGEYISKIVLKRLSGSRESWERVNQSFVQQIRKHFLHWRAVTDDLKEELHAEAKTLLEQQVAGAATHG